MTGSLRYLLAAGFVVLWLLMPAPDHGRLAALKTADWLTSTVLPEATQTGEDENGDPIYGSVMGIRVTVEVVPSRTPMTDVDDLERQLVEMLERTPRTVARGDGREFDENAAPLSLVLRVGATGFQADVAGIGTHGRPVASSITRLASGDGESLGQFYYPDRNSLLPALLTILVAIVTGHVIPALLIGSLAGALLYAGLLAGLPRLAVHTIGTEVLQDLFSIEVIAFVVFLFMAIGVMTRSGGVQGLADAVRKVAKGPVSTQLATYLIGLAIFFDDYANCVITGTTMRPLADRNHVSREKLAYIVDSTAAPIAGISIFSTWVAYEISTFAPQLPEVTKPDGTPFSQSEGFSVFVSTLPFRFYCVFTLVMVVLTILLRRDFGPMGAAQHRAATEGKPFADDARPMLSESFERLTPASGASSPWNALAPLLTLVVLTISLIVFIGYSSSSPDELAGDFGSTMRAILNNTASQRALWISSAVALVFATVLATTRAGVSLPQCAGAAVRSAHSLGFAIIILILAWTIGAVCRDLGTAEYLTAAFQGRFPPWLLPTVMFLLASVVSFSTGTSYGTMAILLPNVVVLAHATGEADPNLTGATMMFLTIGAVLEGSIFGDHCSPISDTTVLSSVATGSDHLHHVRTQAPYALTVVAVAMACGYLPMALFGTGAWMLAWAAGAAALVTILLLVGRRAPDAPPAAA